MTPPLIAIDWGSTNFRARLIAGGELLASFESPDGIRHREGRDFADILESHCAAWKKVHPDARVLMSGMIGSREGWVEVPYITTPASLGDLAAGIVTVDSAVFGPIGIVPGVRHDDDSGTSDVMRGEETQVAGLLHQLPAAGATLCLPGTHSKWIHCREGRIGRFRTWLTGEAFDLLTKGSLIAGSGGEVDVESGAFARGLELSGGGGGLLHHLFLGRTEMLTGRVAAAELRSLVSGLLIGHEIRAARDFAGSDPLFLIGESPAARATAAGLRHFGLAFTTVTDDVHLRGLATILEG